MALPIPNTQCQILKLSNWFKDFLTQKKYTEQVRDWEFGISEIMSKVWPLFFKIYVWFQHKL